MKPRNVFRLGGKRRLFCTVLFLISMIGGMESSDISVQSTYAQLISDRDNDGIPDDSDACPDNPDTACISPLQENSMPVEQSQGGGEQPEITFPHVSGSSDVSGGVEDSGYPDYYSSDVSGSSDVGRDQSPGGGRGIALTDGGAVEGGADATAGGEVTGGEIRGEPGSSNNYYIPGLINGIKQPNGVTCWASVATMMKEWEDQNSYAIETVMGMAGPEYLKQFKKPDGLDPSQLPAFLDATGLVAEAPASYNVDGYLGLLKTYGPLWITTAFNPGESFSLHARILTGISGDGTPTGTIFKFMDPWDGQEHSESFGMFLSKYEAWAGDPSNDLFIQIQHYPAPPPSLNLQ